VHDVLQELSAELLRGFAECLELEDAEVMKPVEDEFIGLFLMHLFIIVIHILLQT